MRLTFWAAFWCFMLDQASKYIVVQAMGLHARGLIEVLPPYVSFQMAWNRGINFGLFASSTEVMRWVLIAVALAIVVWVVLWIRKDHHGRLAHLSAGLLIGGALGNVVDRVLYGGVADFLNVTCCGISNPYSFNIADVSIFAGAAGLIFFTDEKKTP